MFGTLLATAVELSTLTSYCVINASSLKNVFLIKKYIYRTVYLLFFKYELFDVGTFILS